MPWYTIKALDRDGFELRVREDETRNKKEAVRCAREMLSDTDLIDAEIDTVQIEAEGECVWDAFYREN